jgi:hypothetical protein
MGLSRFLSTLALVSLTFSFDSVAARPFKHKEHKTLTKTVHSTYTTILKETPQAPAPNVHSTFYTTYYTTIANGGGSPSPEPEAPAETPTAAHHGTKTSAAQTGTQSPASSNSQYPAQSYSLVKEYSGSSFFDQFTFYTGSDPTNGFVEYVLFSII